MKLRIQRAVRNDYQRDFIKFIISPGTMSTDPNLQPRGPLPTGGNFNVSTISKQWEVNMLPDESGSIILLSLPFFEAPFVRVVLNQTGGFQYWYPIQFPGFKITDSGGGDDPLKTNKIYGYRFTGQSMTGYYNGNMVQAGGSVTAWYQPVSLDTKVVYSDNSISTPTMFVRTLDRVPLTPDDVASVAKVHFTGQAKDGIYIVNRHTDRSVPFTYRDRDQNKCSASVYYADTNSGGLKPVTGDVTIHNYLAFTNDQFYGAFLQDDARTQFIPVSAPTCTDLTGVIFKDVTAAQPITFKFTLGVELIPKMGSPYLNACQTMIPWDGGFLHDLAEAERRLQRMGKANLNDLGSFFRGLNSVMQTVGTVAQAIAPALPPQAQMVVSSLAGTVPKITNALAQATNASKQAVAAAKEVVKMQQSPPGTLTQMSYSGVPTVAQPPARGGRRQ